jgi:hypothetical protein
MPRRQERPRAPGRLPLKEGMYIRPSAVSPLFV